MLLIIIFRFFLPADGRELESAVEVALSELISEERKESFFFQLKV